MSQAVKELKESPTFSMEIQGLGERETSKKKFQSKCVGTRFPDVVPSIPLIPLQPSNGLPRIPRVANTGTPKKRPMCESPPVVGADKRPEKKKKLNKGNMKTSGSGTQVKLHEKTETSRNPPASTVAVETFDADGQNVTLTRSLDGTSWLDNQELVKEALAAHEKLRNFGVTLRNNHSADGDVSSILIPIRGIPQGRAALKVQDSRMYQRYMFTRTTREGIELRTRVYRKSVADGSVTVSVSDMEFMTGDE